MLKCQSTFFYNCILPYDIGCVNRGLHTLQTGGVGIERSGGMGGLVKKAIELHFWK